MHDPDLAAVAIEQGHRVTAATHHPEDVHFVVDESRVGSLEQRVHQRAVRTGDELIAVDVISEAKFLRAAAVAPSVEAGDGAVRIRTA